jgi:hypothetical protein
MSHSPEDHTLRNPPPGGSEIGNLGIALVQATRERPPRDSSICKHDHLAGHCPFCAVEAERDNLRASFAELGAAFIIAKARSVRWVKVCKGGEMPPINKRVRVVFDPSSPSDAKTAIWGGANWFNPSRTGIYDDNPAYWLFEPTIPDPPKP